MMTAAVVLFFSFTGTLAGMWTARRLPEDHISPASRDVVNIAMTLVTTMTALLLGLIIASAKTSYDAKDEAIKHSAVKLLAVDHLLSEYGKEASGIRVMLRNAVAARIEHAWDANGKANGRTSEVTKAAARLESQIHALEPASDSQRELQERALEAADELLETRWLALSHTGSSLPTTFFVLLVFWLVVLFFSFGLFSPDNATVVGSLFVCALVVASAMFLIVELDEPFQGLLKLSDEPLRYALENLETEK